MPYNIDDDRVDLSSDQPTQPSVKDFIAQRLAQNNATLKAAQDKSASDRGMVGLGQGVAQIIAGMSRAPNSFNAAPFKSLEDNASQPVQNYLEQQKSQGNALQQANTEQNIEEKNESLDPESARSKIVRAVMAKYNPDLANTSYSAADAPLIEKLQANKETAETRKEIARGNNISKQAKADSDLDDKFKNNLGKNESYKQADTAANSADALVDLVRNATLNKTSASALPTELANFASKGKRLHTATVDAFTNPNSDILTRIQTGIQKSTNGTIPADVANDITQYLQLEKHAATLQRKSVLAREAEDFHKSHKRYPSFYSPAEEAPASNSPQQPAPGPATDPLQQEMLKRGLLK